MAHTLIVGLGSPHGDDQAGWLVADALSRHEQSELCVRRADSPAELLHWLDGVVRLIICDACQSQGAPGRLHRWTWPTAQLPIGAARGSHDLDLAGVLGLAESIGCLPAQVDVWGIEVDVMEPTTHVSDDVQRGISQAVVAVRQAIARPNAAPA